MLGASIHYIITITSVIPVIFNKITVIYYNLEYCKEIYT